MDIQSKKPVLREILTAAISSVNAELTKVLGSWARDALDDMLAAGPGMLLMIEHVGSWGRDALDDMLAAGPGMLLMTCWQLGQGCS